MFKSSLPLLYKMMNACMDLFEVRSKNNMNVKMMYIKSKRFIDNMTYIHITGVVGGPQMSYLTITLWSTTCFIF